MSRIYNKEGKVIDTDEWIEENHPENGVFKIYWTRDGGVSVEDEGLGQRYEWIYKDGKRGNGPSKGWYPNGNRQVPTHGWKDGVYTQVSRILGENKLKRGLFMPELFFINEDKKIYKFKVIRFRGNLFSAKYFILWFMYSKCFHLRFSY